MIDVVATDGPERVVGDPPASGTDRTTRALQVAVAVVVAAVVATPVISTLTGVRDGFMVNGDEAVAALLPAEFSRGGLDLIFPGNSYQGVLEVPVYAVLWQLAGPYELPMRLFHQITWLLAVAGWAWLAIDVVARARRIGARARWWAALAVAGLLGVTSVIGWSVWFRIYPGYHLGALLGALAVWAALRWRDGAWRWLAAGAFAGLAVYAQPMHAAAVVAVLVAAAVPVRAARAWWQRCGLAGVGVLVGVSPLVVWNVRNSFATLDAGSQPVAHPEWTYLDRWWNTVRITGRVLWGEPDGAVGPLRILVGAVVIGLLGAGVVALVRAGRSGAPLLVVVAGCVVGLPVLSALSLDTDFRYAVGWWPGLVVAVAAGAALVASLESAAWRTTGLVAIGAALVAHGAVVVAGAVPAIDERTQWSSAEAATRDLADDLARCGVSAVVGDYWAVYPAIWGSDAELDGSSQFGPERLDAFAPDSWTEPGRIAVLPPPSVADPIDAANVVRLRTGRGQDDWLVARHPGTGAVVVLERTDDPLPDGCLGDDGLEPA